MTWLGFFNYFVLQWFFIRLARVKRVVDYELDHIAFLPDREIESSGRAITKTKYKILKWIVPLSGWETDYKYIKIRKSKIKKEKLSSSIYMEEVNADK
jgi:hypothetical protein